MTAVKRGDLMRALAKWDADIRLLLFFGKGEGESHEMARASVKALADPADPLSVTDLAPEQLKADPAQLADEAASVSMFGGRRVIRVDGAVDALADAAQLLLDAPAAGNPVVMLAGDLAKTSRLRLLAERSPRALAVVSYEPRGRDAEAMLDRLCRELGLRLEPGVAQRLLATSDSDSRILSSELEKYALFLDASPDRPARLERRHLAALGADSAEEDMFALAAAVVAGDRRAAERQYQLLAGSSSIPVLRAVARRLLQLAEAREAMAAGASAEAAVRGLRPPPFQADAARLAAALPDWPQPRIARALAQLLAGEQAIKTPGGPGEAAGWQAILALAPELSPRLSTDRQSA
jgi:DNA polymerase-3 subunit delta